MAEAHSELEVVAELLKQLTPIDKVRLLGGVIPDLEAATGGREKAAALLVRRTSRLGFRTLG